MNLKFSLFPNFGCCPKFFCMANKWKLCVFQVKPVGMKVIRKISQKVSDSQGLVLSPQHYTFGLGCNGTSTLTSCGFCRDGEHLRGSMAKAGSCCCDKSTSIFATSPEPLRFNAINLPFARSRFIFGLVMSQLTKICLAGDCPWITFAANTWGYFPPPSFPGFCFIRIMVWNTLSSGEKSHGYLSGSTVLSLSYRLEIPTWF